MRSLVLITLFLILMTACGKKGPLHYPDMLVPTSTTDTSASQIGSSVKLQFVLPENDRTGRKLLDLGGVTISKRVSDSNQDQLCGSCMSDYRLFRKLYLELLPDIARRYGNRILVIDGDVIAGKSYSYSVVPFTQDGVDGVASPQVSVLLVQPTLPPVLHAESFPTEIKISFVSPPPVSGHFVGYNIYRTSQQGMVPYMPINREPLPGNDYIDSGIERNVTYHYMARTVVKLESGNLVESPVSNVVDGLLKNDE
jgi:predicted small lipoprotein YifL